MMNIKSLLILVFAGLLSIGTKGQSKHETYLGYGYYSVPNMTDSYSKLLPKEITAETYQFDHGKYSGTIYAGYNFNKYNKVLRNYRNNRVKYGVRVGFETASNDLYISGKKEGEWKATFVTVLGSLRYRYIIKPVFQMYSGAELGACLMFEQIDSSQENTSDNSVLFAFQLDMVGFRFGGDFGVFLELGAGYMGLVNGGFSYQF